MAEKSNTENPSSAKALSKKQSMADFLTRLRTPTQASRNRMLATNPSSQVQQEKLRSISAPFVSTSSNYPDFLNKMPDPQAKITGNPSALRSADSLRSLLQNPRKSPKRLSSKSFPPDIQISKPIALDVRSNQSLTSKGFLPVTPVRSQLSPRLTKHSPPGLPSASAAATTSSNTPSHLKHLRRQSAPAPNVNVCPRRMAKEIQTRGPSVKEKSSPTASTPPARLRPRTNSKDSLGSLAGDRSDSGSVRPSSKELKDYNESLKIRNMQLRTRLSEAFTEIDQTTVDLAVTKASRDTLQQQVNGYQVLIEGMTKKVDTSEKELKKAHKLIKLLAANVQELKTSLEEKQLENYSQRRERNSQIKPLRLKMSSVSSFDLPETPLYTAHQPGEIHA